MFWLEELREASVDDWSWGARRKDGVGEVAVAVVVVSVYACYAPLFYR